MNKAKIDGKIIDVISREEYVKYKDSGKYDNNYTGVQIDDMIYPMRSPSDTRPGIYNYGAYFVRTQIPEELKHSYSSDNMVNFDDAKTIAEVIEAQSKLRGMERTILTSVDNLFVPVVKDEDTPEMAALKTAIINKKIDISKYEQRFGDSFNNDKRLFNGNSITLSKIKSIANALDIKVTLTLEDTNPDVANPMGEPVVATLMGGDDE